MNIRQNLSSGPERRQDEQDGAEGARRQSGADVPRPLTLPPILHPGFSSCRIGGVVIWPIHLNIGAREKGGGTEKEEIVFEAPPLPKYEGKSSHMCCPYSPDRDSTFGLGLSWSGEGGKGEIRD